YRVETLGRLQTKLALGTSFLPSLDKAEANGAGENALLQTYLRAGRYRVTASASESAGRLGLSARPSRLIDGNALVPDGGVRATLEGGAGAVFPIEIKERRRYRLELLGLGRPFEVSQGMIGEIKRLGAPDEAVGKIAEKNGFSGRLNPGRYEIEARSLGRNDRLDYTVSLRAKEIQPGRSRKATLPATIPFAIAEDRVVSLTTFGRIDVRGVLKDADGRVIERLDDRTDDWNIALSRQLPAGSYRLELSAVPGQPTKAKPE